LRLNPRQIENRITSALYVYRKLLKSSLTIAVSLLFQEVNSNTMKFVDQSHDQSIKTILHRSLHSASLLIATKIKTETIN